LNRYVYDSELLEILLRKCLGIKLCLDIGRLHLQDKLDKNFDSHEFTKRFAKYAEVIHLWNVKVTSYAVIEFVGIISKMEGLKL